MALAWGLYDVTGHIPGFVHLDTAEILMWAGLGFELDVGKHPPFMPWLFRVAGFVIPMDRYGLLMLSALNLALGAYATWRLARLTVGIERAAVALLLFSLMPLATVQALKLNHNSILLSLWPLAVWAFVASLKRPTLTSGLLLGLAGGIGFLAKYFMLVLLAAMFVASLASPQRRAFYRSPAPYAAVGLFALLVAPHIFATYLPGVYSLDGLQQHLNGLNTPLGYAFKQPRSGSTFPLRIILANALTLLPVISAFAFMRWRLGGGTDLDKSADRAGFTTILILLIVPYALTLGIVLGAGLRESPGWSMPVLALLPIVLAGLTAPLPLTALPHIKRILIGVAVAIPMSGPIVLYSHFKRGSESAIIPVVSIANGAAELWTRATAKPLVFAGGDHRLALGVSLEQRGRVKVWSNFMPQPWIKPGMVAEHGLLAICIVSDGDCQMKAAALADGRGAVCRIARTQKLYGMRGPEYVARVYLIPPRGEQFNASRISGDCGPV